ncbi:PQQ-binding-like beta-propeller repeat protein [Pseudoduganella sp. FT93W]|uniref:PQQ-binding-like beta-propeller repeat protein n=1 Tax=Duganella fentianensis TaxID=2692177 RepID=A0A845I2W3_9BURK|nr:PQQ-binding-like beta-propeller repeat protein [Duganella fentianensis]MYN46081.1 PQQ-binding-like beta-propeller repeat protein [Duganella fentianensis]
MKGIYRTGLVLTSIVLSACGGGSSPQTPPLPPVPPIPPSPSVAVTSGNINRVQAMNTSLRIEVTAQAANFSPSGTLYASASDGDSLMQAPVTVSSNSNGSYTFALDTQASKESGHYSGKLTIKLCSDAACNTAQAVPSISVPYDITVHSPNSAWPGDQLTPLAPWNGVPDWATFQGNNAHTGYVPVEIKADQMQLRWKRGAVNNSTSGYNASISPLVTANGRFYASGDKKLTAYQENDGKALWSYDTSGLSNPGANPPAVDNGVVYFAAGQQNTTYMIALDAVDGSARMKSAMSSQWERYLSPIVQDGAIYTNSGSYGGMYAFASTGERLFFQGLSQTSMWSPATDGRSIFAYTGDALTIVQPKTGTVLSTIRDSSFTNYVYQLGGAAVVGANGGVYAAAYANGYLNDGSIGNQLIRFDTAKGFLDWRVPGVYRVTPAYADGVLYAPNFNPYRLEARSEADGKLLWSWVPPLGGEVSFHASPVVTKNLLFISTNVNTYALDLKTRKVVWSYPAPGYLAISASGLLYIQSPDALVAVNLK